jgi:hypothetical protein
MSGVWAPLLLIGAVFEVRTQRRLLLNLNS